MRQVVLAVALVSFLATMIRAEASIWANEQSSAQPRGWRGLVPLRSTRRDAEAVIGAPKTPGGSSYETADSTIFVQYSDGPCEKGWPYGWDVERDTVVMINVSQKQALRLTDLKLDERNYLKSRDSHINTKIHYVNHDEGVEIDVDEMTGNVTGLAYMPTSSEANRRCPEASKRLSTARAQADSFFKFDLYGDLSPGLERERLDNLAAELIRRPDSDAYIIAYAGTTAQSGEAKTRAACAKDYLIKKHLISPDRIWAVDRGYREVREVELYVESRGGPLPLPTPTVRPGKVKIFGQSKYHCLLARG